MKRFTSGGLTTLSVFAVFILIATTFFLVATSAGTTLLLKNILPILESRLPGLSLTAENSGPLIKGLRIKKVSFNNSKVSVNGDNLDIKLSYFCRPSVLICAENIKLETLALEIIDSSTDSEIETNEKKKQPISLPDIEFPIPFLIKDFSLTSFSLLSSEPLDALQNIRWQGKNILLKKSDLKLGQLTLQNKFFSYQAKGNIKLNKEYPIRLDQFFDFKPSENNALIAMNAIFSGSVSNLTIHIETKAPQITTLSLTVSPLITALPIVSEFNAKSFNIQDWIPSAKKPVRVKDLSLNIEGNRSRRTVGLNGHINIENHIEKAGEGYEMNINDNIFSPLSLKSVLFTTYAEIQAFTLGDEDRGISLNGTIDWQSQLSGKLNLRMNQFDSTVILPLKPNLLTGEIILEFSSKRDFSEYLVNVQLNGTQLIWNNSPFLLQGSVSHNSIGSQFNQISITSAKSQLSLDGSIVSLAQLNTDSTLAIIDWLSESNLQIAVNAKDLSQIDPQLTGEIVGKFNSRESNSIKLNVTGNHLSFSDNKIEELTARIDLSSESFFSKPSTAYLDANTIRIGDSNIDTVKLKVNGKPQHHVASLSAQSASMRLSALLTGDFKQKSNKWLIEWGSFNFDTMNTSNSSSKNLVTLARPATIKWSTTSDNVNVSDICFDIGRGNVDINSDQDLVHSAGLFCTQTAQLEPSTFKVPFSFHDINLDLLQTISPNMLNVKGRLFGSGAISKKENSDLFFTAVIESSGGSISNDNDRHIGAESHITLPFNEFKAVVSSSPRMLVLNAALDAKENGDMKASVKLSGPAFKSIESHFSLEDFPIELLSPLVPKLAGIKGKLNSQLALSGSTEQPMINGKFQLSDAGLQLANDSTPIKDLSLTGTFEQSELFFNGGFTSGEGKAEINGRLDFEKELSGNFKILAKQLTVEPIPSIELKADGDLEVKLLGRTLFVSGDLSIPNGEISILELPTSAIILSRDAEFLREDKEGESNKAAFVIETSIRLSLGPDLKFSGFNAKGELQGTLQIENRRDKPPSANGEVNFLHSKYRGYGQKLDVRRGRLLFSGRLDEPDIDLEAIRKVGEAVVGIRVSGNAKNPQIIPFSEPSLPENDIIYRLVTGSGPGQSASPNEQRLIASALIAGSVRIGGQTLTESAENLGIQDFSIGSSDDSDLLLSGYLNPSLYLEYGVGALGNNGGFKLRWDFAKRLSLEFISGLQNSMDIIYNKEF